MTSLPLRLVSSIPVLRAVPIVYHYRRKFGRWPNLVAPKRFTEKLQVAKLNWRSPLMPMLADKVLAKEHVARVLGPQWVTPTLYAGRTLPPLDARDWVMPYVIKANNRSSSNRFVMTEADKDWSAIERDVESWLKTSYSHGFQWVYTQIPPRVLVEPFIGGGSEPPWDYRLFVFGGRVELVQVDIGPPPGGSRAFFTRHWERLPFVIKRRNEEGPVHQPRTFEQMVAAAETLAKGFPFVRIDFYEVDGQPRFGEVTFYPGGGWGRFYPDSYDEYFGGLWPEGRPADTLPEGPDRS